MHAMNFFTRLIIQSFIAYYYAYLITYTYTIIHTILLCDQDQDSRTSNVWRIPNLCIILIYDQFLEEKECQDK